MPACAPTATSKGRLPLPWPALLRAPALPRTCCTGHDWSESSLILELFTRDHGRVVAVAKGAKRTVFANCDRC